MRRSSLLLIEMQKKREGKWGQDWRRKTDYTTDQTPPPTPPPPTLPAAGGFWSAEGEAVEREKSLIAGLTSEGREFPKREAFFKKKVLFVEDIIWESVFILLMHSGIPSGNFWPLVEPLSPLVGGGALKRSLLDPVPEKPAYECKHLLSSTPQ